MRKLLLPILGIWAIASGAFAYTPAQSVAITGGSIDGTTVGATTPSTGQFSGLTLSNITGSNQCLHVNSAGVVSGMGADCGAGGGGGTVTSVFGRTGVVTAQSGDYSAAQISGLGTSATVNTGTSGTTLCLLNANCTFSGTLAFNAGITTSGALDTFAVTNAGAIGSVAYFENSGTWATGQGADIRLVPSTASSGSILRAVANSATNNSDLELYTRNAGSAIEALVLSPAGALQLPTYTTAGLLQTNASGNVTSTGYSIGSSGATVPLLNGNNTFSGATEFGTSVPGSYSAGTINVQNGIYISNNSSGSPGYRNYTMFGATAADGNGDLIDLVTFNNGGGNDVSSGVTVENYGCTKAAPCATPSQTNIGGIGGAAFDGAGDDPVGAWIQFYTTQTWTSSAQGEASCIGETLNGSTGSFNGFCLNPKGNGGVFVGNMSGGLTAATDLGIGTIAAGSDIATAGHFRSNGTTPTLSSCGSGATITGTDNAGQISNPSGGITACTVNFHTAFSGNPVCIVQTYANATPVTIINGVNTASFTADWTSSFTGTWFYICMGKQ